MTVKARYTEEEFRELGGQCEKHSLKLEARDDYYTCPGCQAEALKEMSTCTLCGATIKWATTPDKKKLPMNYKTVTGRLENGEWVKVHISHSITCKNAEEFKKDPERKQGEAPERRPSDAPPRTGAPWDKCKVCGIATDYSLSNQQSDGGYFENWNCPDDHGWWWRKKNSGYKPQWRDK